MNYIYYFTDYSSKIIYVGKTHDIKKRIRQHFTGGHLPEECYSSVYQIFFAETGNSLYDNEIIETIMIDKYKPKYNTDKVYSERYEKLTFELPGFKWKELWIRYKRNGMEVFLSNPGYECFNRHLFRAERVKELINYDIHLIEKRRIYVKEMLSGILRIYGDELLDEFVSFLKCSDISVVSSSIEEPLNEEDENVAWSGVRVERKGEVDRLERSGLIFYIDGEFYGIPLLNHETLKYINKKICKKETTG